MLALLACGIIGSGVLLRLSQEGFYPSWQPPIRFTDRVSGALWNKGLSGGVLHQLLCVLDLAFQRRTTGCAVRGPKNEWGIERGSKTPFHLKLVRLRAREGVQVPLSLEFVRLRAREGVQAPPFILSLCASAHGRGSKSPFRLNLRASAHGRGTSSPFKQSAD